MGGLYKYFSIKVVGTQRNLGWFKLMMKGATHHPGLDMGGSWTGYVPIKGRRDEDQEVVGCRGTEYQGDRRLKGKLYKSIIVKKISETCNTVFELIKYTKEDFPLIFENANLL